MEASNDEGVYSIRGHSPKATKSEIAGRILGKRGRHVQEAFVLAQGKIGADLSKQSQESLQAIFSEDFNNTKNRS